MIMEYYSAKGACLNDLDEDVNLMIKKGFRPLGSPYLIPLQKRVSHVVVQAMVKEVCSPDGPVEQEQPIGRAKMETVCECNTMYPGCAHLGGICPNGGECYKPSPCSSNNCTYK